MKYCHKCGNSLREEDKFCQKCGEKSVLMNNDNPHTADAPKTEHSQSLQQSQNSDLYKSPIQEKQSKSTRKTILIIGVLIILIVFLTVGGIAAYFLILKKTETSPVNIQKDDKKEMSSTDKTIKNPDENKKKEISENKTEKQDENLSKKQISNSNDCGDYTELSARKISAEELAEMPKSELRIMRNEIFMRHGMKFKSKDLQDHFSQYDCYNPMYDDVTQYLTEIERYNLELLKKYEK